MVKIRDLNGKKGAVGKDAGCGRHLDFRKRRGVFRWNVSEPSGHSENGLVRMVKHDEQVIVGVFSYNGDIIAGESKAPNKAHHIQEARD